MYADVSQLLTAVPADAKKPAYCDAIIHQNVLSKATAATRLESYERLSQLYGLDPSVVLFRALRFFWDLDADARPMLAFLCSIARDPILRVTAPVVLDANEGELVNPQAFRDQVAACMPDRFNGGSLRRIASNIASSWTQSGHLRGRQRKTRVVPPVSSGAAAYAILLGYLSGIRGKPLFVTFWSRVAAPYPGPLISAAIAGARRGWLEFKRSGDVFEIRFPDLLTPSEDEASREPD